MLYPDTISCLGILVYFQNMIIYIDKLNISIHIGFLYMVSYKHVRKNTHLETSSRLKVAALEYGDNVWCSWGALLIWVALFRPISLILTLCHLLNCKTSLSQTPLSLSLMELLFVCFCACLWWDKRKKGNNVNSINPIVGDGASVCDPYGYVNESPSF